MMRVHARDKFDQEIAVGDYLLNVTKTSCSVRMCICKVTWIGLNKVSVIAARKDWRNMHVYHTQLTANNFIRLIQPPFDYGKAIADYEAGTD
jgi:hypothetical protein